MVCALWRSRKLLYIRIMQLRRKNKGEYDMGTWKQTPFFYIFAILVLVLALVACDNGDKNENGNKKVVNETSGRLTITGIPSKFNGKWIMGQIYSGVGIILFAGNGFTEDLLIVKGVQIEDETATLKVWKAENNSRDNYTGNDTLTNFRLFVNDEMISESFDIYLFPDKTSKVNVTFANGIGVVVWSTD